MYDVLHFWLERGVDGFRIDALEVLLKDEQFRDNPINPTWKPGDPPNTRLIEHYIVDQPGMHDIMQEMRALTESYSQRVLIGELYLPLERLMHVLWRAARRNSPPLQFPIRDHANLG